MIKLYYSPRTRAARTRWMLEEIGADYELVRVNLKEGEHKRPDYMGVHPLGVVPALELDGQVVLESAAQVLTLGDNFPDAGLAPAPGTPERALYYQWVVYVIGSAEPAIFGVFRARGDEEQTARAVAHMQQVNGLVTEALSDGRPWLLGEQFSGADVMVGAGLAFAKGAGMLGDDPTLNAYLGRLFQRPAFQRANAD